MFSMPFVDGYGGECVLDTNYVLANRHHLLEGTSYSILAKAFTEEGGLLMECLSDDCKKQLHSVIKVEPSAILTPSEVSILCSMLKYKRDG